MKRLVLSASLGTLALAIPLLSASDALANATATCRTSGGTVVQIHDPKSCHFETGASCTSQCTPVNYTTTCSTMCTEGATTTCTNTCEEKCTVDCTTMPATFSCEDHCSTDCHAGCMASCDSGDCETECSASCDTECKQKCEVHPGSTDCTTQCQDCCSGSCTVQANISCNESCVSKLDGGCTTKCKETRGGLFCDDQYIDVNAVTDCTFSIRATTTGSLSTSCAAAPGNDSRFGLPAAAFAIAGLGLFVARRRRRSQGRPGESQ
jgi:MYXO-CTERM domain-containing protein